MRKGEPMGDGSRLENGRAMSLGGSTPPPSASRGVRYVPLAERSRHRLPMPDRRVRLPQGTLGDRLTAGYPALNRTVEVRVLLPEPARGETHQTYEQFDPGQLLLVVTPGSDPGGRWFDSSPRNCETTEAIRPDQGLVLNTGGGRRPLVGSSPTASASRGPGTPTDERPGLKPGACGSTPTLGISTDLAR
jgi:hypothetical protein